MTLFQTTFAAAAMFVAFTSASEAALQLNAVSSPADLSNLSVGATFSLTITTDSDFPNFTGGGFNVEFDPAVLTYLDGIFDTAFFFTNDQAPDTDGVAANVTFNVFPLIPVGGNQDIVTLLFETVGPGTTTIALAAPSAAGANFTNAGNNSDFAGQVFTYPVVDVTVVSPQQVTLPATVGLLFFGIASALIASHRRRC